MYAMYGIGRDYAYVCYNCYNAHMEVVLVCPTYVQAARECGFFMKEVKRVWLEQRQACTR